MRPTDAATLAQVSEHEPVCRSGKAALSRGSPHGFSMPRQSLSDNTRVRGDGQGHDVVAGTSRSRKMRASLALDNAGTRFGGKPTAGVSRQPRTNTTVKVAPMQVEAAAACSRR